MLVKRTSSVEPRPKTTYIYTHVNILTYIQMLDTYQYSHRQSSKKNSVYAYWNVKHKKLSFEKRRGGTLFLAYAANSYVSFYVLSVVSSSNAGQKIIVRRSYVEARLTTTYMCI